RHSKHSRIKMSKIMKERAKTKDFKKWLLENSIKMRGKNNHNARRVICINTGEVFNTCTEAGGYFSISGKSIWRVCNGDRITTNGLQFAFYDEGKTYKPKELPKRTRGNHHSARKIICINNGIIFDSIVSASEYFNI